MASVENTKSPVDELVAWAQDSGGTLSKAEIEVEQRRLLRIEGGSQGTPGPAELTWKRR